jgi:hypothetical protein
VPVGAIVIPRAILYRYCQIVAPFARRDKIQALVENETPKDGTMSNSYFRFAVAWCLPILLLGVRPKSAQSETIRFLVSEFGTAVHHDSYVLPLSDPDDIAHARRLITDGPGIGAPLAVAKIAKGSNGINRNYLAAGSPAWSWHVSAFEGFADSTIEILDGWPIYVEGDIDGWIANTNSYVGFWRYTVTAELPQGDYDADLDVDADDYHVWRAGFGGKVDLSADGNGDGIVDAADYAVWRKNLGTSTTLPSQTASATSVPEPATLHLAWICGVLLYISTMNRASLRELGWLNDVI